MADEAQYIKLPDGSFGKFPASATDAQIRTQLSKDFPKEFPLVSGEGMQEKAQQQARADIAKPLENAQHPGESNLHFRESQKIGRPAMQKQADQFNEAAPYIAGAAGVAMPFIDAGGILPGLVKLGSSAVGAAGGKWAGQRVGGELFGEPGREIGGGVGETAGGALGYASPGILGKTIEHFAGPGSVPSWISPPSEPTVQSIRESPNFNSTEYAAGKKAGGINPRGFSANLPKTIPEQKPELGSPENPDFHSNLPTRMPKIMTPKTTTNIGGEELPEIPGVIVAPEPRPLAPGEKPGSMYSVPRARLKGMAKTGKPGAVDVLRDIGQPSVLVPREGVGYPGPRAETGAPTLEDIQDAIRRRPQIAAD